MRILCLNSGSSSLKFALYDLSASGEHALTSGEEPRRDDNTHGAVTRVLAALDAGGVAAPEAVGHRLVFGGVLHDAPALVDAALLDTLRGLSRFAPLHMPAGLAAIDAACEHLPDVPQVACFDSAFHRRMPEVTQRLPLDRALWDEGVRRIGFHGLSYEYVVDAVGAARIGRGVIAHLGHGASMAAVRNGDPIDTTMGFTPTGGIMMSTRSGDLDPGVLLYLLREKSFDAAAVESFVVRQAGLLAVSGASGDMEQLLAARRTDARAAMAIEMFCYQVRKQIGAYAAALGGVDTLIFTGGIGEHAAPIRLEACRGLAHLGIEIDEHANERHAAVISAAGAACTVRVVPTNENLMIARHTYALVKGRS